MRRLAVGVFRQASDRLLNFVAFEPGEDGDGTDGIDSNIFYNWFQ